MLQCSRPWNYRTGRDIYQILDDFFVRDSIRFKGFKGKHTTKLIRILQTYFMYVTDCSTSEIDNIKIIMYLARLAHSVEHWTCNPNVTGLIPALDYVNLLSTFYFLNMFHYRMISWYYYIENAILRLFIYLHVIFETVKKSLFNNF